jgi:hypothetical protein
MRPGIPTFGDTGLLGAGTTEKVNALLDNANRAVEASAAEKILRGLGIGGASAPGIPEGTDKLLSGAADAFGKMADLALKMADRGTGGGGDGQMVAVVVNLMGGFQQTMMTLLQQMQEASEKRWAALLEQERNHWQSRYEDLQQRSGPSNLDSLVHGNLLPSLLQGWADDWRVRLNERNRDPLEYIAEQAERLEKAQGALQRLAPKPASEWTPERLQARAYDIEEKKIEKGYQKEKEEREHAAALPMKYAEAVEKAASAVGQALVSVFGGTGWVPAGGVPAGAEQAARRIFDAGGED